MHKMGHFHWIHSYHDQVNARLRGALCMARKIACLCSGSKFGFCLSATSATQRPLARSLWLQLTRMGVCCWCRRWFDARQSICVQSESPDDFIKPIGALTASDGRISLVTWRIFLCFRLCRCKPNRRTGLVVANNAKTQQFMNMQNDYAHNEDYMHVMKRNGGAIMLIRFFVCTKHGSCLVWYSNWCHPLWRV